MRKSRAKDPSEVTATLPRVDIPPIEHVTAEEIARRRSLFEHTMRLRDKIGPIDIPADELIHQVRAEAGT